MNWINALIYVIPIFSAILSVVLSLFTVIIRNRLKQEIIDKKKVLIKLNNEEFEINEHDEEKTVEIILQIADKEKTFSSKTEDIVNEENSFK